MGMRQRGVMVVKDSTEAMSEKKLCTEVCYSNDGNEQCTGVHCKDTETGTGATPREQRSGQRASFTEITTAAMGEQLRNDELRKGCKK